MKIDVIWNTAKYDTKLNAQSYLLTARVFQLGKSPLHFKEKQMVF